MILGLIFMIGDSSVQVGIENMGGNMFMISFCVSEEMFWLVELIIIKRFEGNGQGKLPENIVCLLILQVWQILLFG